jgi:hypothetical protein
VTSRWESVTDGGGRALSAMVHRSRPLPAFRRYVGGGNFMA